MLDKLLNFVEKYYLFTSYVVGFNIIAWDMDIFTQEFLFFLIISPIIATFTGMIVLFAIVIILLPIAYIIDFSKMMFCDHFKNGDFDF
jgi:hypothetical protein